MADCPECGRGFDTEAGMKRHYGHKHEGTLAGVPVECETCGATVRKRKAHVENFDKHYCGNECQGSDWVGRYSGEKHARYNRVEVECSHCGELFTRSKSTSKGHEHMFCDQDCYSQWQAENRVGSDAFNWRGGYKDYNGPNWRQHRRKRLEYDDYECVACGIGNEEHKERFGWGLEIHHIERKENFRDESGELDYKRANRLENLITLCRVCHRRWEGIPLRPQT